MQRIIIATLALAAAFLSTMAHGQDDHGNTRQTATSVAVPSDTSGTINPGTDVDYFRFEVSAATAIVMETTGSLDTFGRLWDSGGTQVNTRDDGGTGGNFRIRWMLSAGTYYVSVESYNNVNTGSYTLQIRASEGQRITPHLDLSQTGREGILTLSIETLSSESGRTITVDGVTYHSVWDREFTHLFPVRRQWQERQAGFLPLGFREHGFLAWERFTSAGPSRCRCRYLQLYP